MTEDLVSVRDRIANLPRLDPNLRGFGASSHRYYPCPVLLEAELAEFEQRAGFALPGGYRDFLRSVAGGGVGPGHGMTWLAAALAEQSGDDDLWALAVVPKVFASADRLSHFAVATAAASSSASDDDWPDFLPPKAVRKQTAPRRPEHINFILRVSRNTRGLLSAEGVQQLSRTFDLEQGIDAEPEISSIDWDSLRSAETQVELDKLWDLKGFDRAFHGTIPLCDYGHGISALLVARGRRAGAVWILDEENLLLEPFSETWLEMHSSNLPRPFRGASFLDWYLDWLSCAEQPGE
jgi:hypothetical protein